MQPYTSAIGLVSHPKNGPRVRVEHGLDMHAPKYSGNAAKIPSVIGIITYPKINPHVRND